MLQERAAEAAEEPVTPWPLLPPRRAQLPSEAVVAEVVVVGPVEAHVGDS